MKGRYKPVLAALLLTALALGLWQWRDQQLEQRALRREAWLAYLRGPLSDLLYGSSRGRALLEQSRQRALRPAERKALAEAAASVQNAWAAARRPEALWQQDPFFDGLKQGLHWHHALAELAKDWHRLPQRQELLPDALAAERGLRQSLAGVLSQQREGMVKELALKQDALLEMNALIWSLKED
jgi:hypothetical protein